MSWNIGVFRGIPGGWRFKLISWLLKDDERYLLSRAIELRLEQLQSVRYEKWVDTDNIKRDIGDLESLRDSLRLWKW